MPAMTAKDLHFSFDSALAAEQPATMAPAGLPETADFAAEPANMRSPSAARANRPRTSANEAKSVRRAWLTASFVALVNMAFLVLAALWLTGATHQIPGLKLAATPAANQLDGESLAAVQVDLEANAKQLAELSAVLEAQSEMLAAIQAQLARLEDSVTTSVAAVAETESTTDDWQINLGSFASAEGAKRLQAELASMGYVAQVGGPEAQGDSAYRVWLGGYEDREAADTVAHQLMDTTSLTGLWVLNGH